jgi:hypothetical protein
MASSIIDSKSSTGRSIRPILIPTPQEGVGRGSRSRNGSKGGSCSGAEAEAEAEAVVH